MYPSLQTQGHSSATTGPAATATARAASRAMLAVPHANQSTPQPLLWLLLMEVMGSLTTNQTPRRRPRHEIRGRIDAGNEMRNTIC